MTLLLNLSGRRRNLRGKSLSLSRCCLKSNLRHALLLLWHLHKLQRCLVQLAVRSLVHQHLLRIYCLWNIYQLTRPLWVC